MGKIEGHLPTVMSFCWVVIIRVQYINIIVIIFSLFYIKEVLKFKGTDQV